MGDARGRPDASVTAPAWNAVLLVCRDCRKRSNGPRKPKPKALAQALKTAMHDARPRPRVVLTSCLGSCPKRATAVARVGGPGEGAGITAIATLRDAEKAFSR